MSKTRQSFAKVLSFAETPRVKTERQIKNAVVPLPLPIEQEQHSSFENEPEPVQ